ncbi:hypothetical protein ACFY4C_11615 [Actinomadura viridis]
MTGDGAPEAAAEGEERPEAPEEPLKRAGRRPARPLPVPGPPAAVEARR